MDMVVRYPARRRTKRCCRPGPIRTVRVGGDGDGYIPIMYATQPAMHPLDLLGRLVLAALLGGLLGAERELDGQDAGFRTHLLLALGAGLFGAVSVGAFDGFIDDSGDTNVRVDVTRVASYVAAGIGFIGGGAILKHRGTITGVTTATSLWTTAAVGLAAGLGFWLGALATAALALIALWALQPFSAWLQRRSASTRGRSATTED